jgi:hypothetical protein
LGLGQGLVELVGFVTYRKLFKLKVLGLGYRKMTEGLRLGQGGVALFMILRGLVVFSRV